MFVFAITNRLIVIGGDGSLTGASKLYAEWPELAAEIKSESIAKLEKGEQVIPQLTPEVSFDTRSK